MFGKSAFPCKFIVFFVYLRPEAGAHKISEETDESSTLYIEIITYCVRFALGVGGVI